jgi:hypothetical protein
MRRGLRPSSPSCVVCGLRGCFVFPQRTSFTSNNETMSSAQQSGENQKDTLVTVRAFLTKSVLQMPTASSRSVFLNKRNSSRMHIVEELHAMSLRPATSHSRVKLSVDRLAINSQNFVMSHVLSNDQRTVPCLLNLCTLCSNDTHSLSKSSNSAV